jgi:hypothetical protein
MPNKLDKHLKETLKQIQFDSISDWILKEIESLNKENNELIEWKSDMHPHPSAMSNMCRLQKSNACRAKIEAYIKLLDFMEGIKDAH